MTALGRFFAAAKGLMFRAPLMMTCAEFEGFVLDYEAGTLPAGQARLFRLHLAVCPDCRRYLAAYRATVALGQRAFADSAASLPDEVPEDLVQAILAARNAE